DPNVNITGKQKRRVDREILSRTARGWASRRRVSAFSGCRGAALNQSRSASGVYTGLLCRHGCGNQ
ncbi:hypothetical protein E4S82_24745, partial [Salmonella enterica subsp. enterica serovar Anatum]|nr:hypothetical protein [Salmonella enterica subsp. enterica serovar Anatum]